MKCSKCEYRMITTEVIGGKKILQCANDKCSNKVVEFLTATEIAHLVNEQCELRHKLLIATEHRERKAIKNNIALIERSLKG